MKIFFICYLQTFCIIRLCLVTFSSDCCCHVPHIIEKWCIKVILELNNDKSGFNVRKALWFQEYLKRMRGIITNSRVPKNHSQNWYLSQIKIFWDAVRRDLSILAFFSYPIIVVPVEVHRNMLCQIFVDCRLQYPANLNHEGLQCK
jgi:hypothetical protein